MTLSINRVEVEDTYCEAFEGLFSRLLVTASSGKLLRRAALSSTALPLTVMGESEAGIESLVSRSQTPDKRMGAIIQVWVNCGKNASEKLEQELGKRIRQGILVVPSTRVFNALESRDKIETMRRIGHCGDGYEFVEQRFGREVINVPIMMGEFLIERFLGCDRGVAGGNLWFFCASQEAALRAGEKALEAMGKVEGVVAPFEICSAGSKVETRYPEIGPTTNHPYCPTLRGKISDSRVPEGIESIPEIVINGVSIDAVREAMGQALRAASKVKGVKKISAGNYGGKLGKYKIFMKELI